MAPCNRPAVSPEWHRRNLLHCLCRSLGPAWVSAFAAGHGKLVMYVAVDHNNRFCAIEHFYSSADSARLAESGFLSLSKPVWLRQAFAGPPRRAQSRTPTTRCT
ncbi:hypothetical protein [Hymenobacter fastidiosus]|uniref:hypothetical protein n=1 Tax=Hymenobacter fastidiosus TaxID=486264 RepID=UPI0031EF6DD0